MQTTFAAEILVIRLARTSSSDLSRRVASVAGIPDRQIVCKANRQQNHAASGIVSNKKVMKAARN